MTVQINKFIHIHTRVLKEEEEASEIGMAQSGKTKTQNTGNKKGKDKVKKEFQWTDDEAELLLNVTCDYKNAKAMVNTDWESIKSKYEDTFFRAFSIGVTH